MRDPELIVKLLRDMSATDNGRIYAHDTARVID